jgi:hypothetical protein
VSQPIVETAVSSARSQGNPFNLMMNARANYVILPPLLNHERMYANHELHNELIAFMENRDLGWTKDDVSTIGKRFVDGMSKALFKCCPAVWKALYNNQNSGALFLSRFLFHLIDSVFSKIYNVLLQVVPSYLMHYCNRFSSQSIHLARTIARGAGTSTWPTSTWWTLLWTWRNGSQEIIGRMGVGLCF